MARYSRTRVSRRLKWRRDPGDVPHHLPGQNPYLGEFAKKHNLPIEATRGGAETALPEFAKKLVKK